MPNFSDFNFDPDKIQQLKVGKMTVGNTVYEGLEFDLTKPEEKQAYEELRAEARNTPVTPPQEQQKPPLDPEARALLDILVADKKEQLEEKKSHPSKKPEQINFFSELFPKFIRYKTTAGVKDSSIKDYWSFRQMYLDVLGDKPVGHVTNADAINFRDIIQQLPLNRNKGGAYQGKSIEEIISIREQIGDDCLAGSTIDKYIINGSTFFDWAKECGYVFINHFKGKTIMSKAKREEAAEEARKPFDEADLKIIFDPINYGSRKTPHDFWIPLIAAFGGMRLSEISQLYVNDVIYKHEVWTFNINKDTKDKKLKTRTSKRLVPIHPTLIDLGFLDYVDDVKKSGKERLFPNLKKSTYGYGRSPGRNFASYMDSIGISDSEKVFHSFRHTFANTLKKNLVDEEARSELMGPFPATTSHPRDCWRQLQHPQIYCCHRSLS